MDIWCWMIISSLFKVIWMCTWNGPNIGVSWSCKSKTNFWIKYVNLAQLGGSWVLVKLVAWKCTLCEFCQSRWITKNPICNQNGSCGLNMKISEFMGAFWATMWRQILKNVYHVEESKWTRKFRWISIIVSSCWTFWGLYIVNFSCRGCQCQREFLICGVNTLL